MSDRAGTVENTKRRHAAFWAMLSLLRRDPFAIAAAGFLLLLLVGAVLGPLLFEASALKVNLRLRTVPPFGLANGWMYVLGGDTLGRPVLVRIMLASQTTLLIALSAVALAFVVGTALGLVASMAGGVVESLILRATDVIMSFPSLLLALVVLFVLGPEVQNVVLVLAFSRVPVYLRTCRAEVLEVGQRLHVTAARVLGAGTLRLARWHILPLVLPSLVTIATLDFATVLLAESGLSFLGLGVQSPGFTWGLMVADGREYLSVAWWVAFWPGMTIALAAISANLLANWLRTVNDPMQRWRLEAGSH